MQMKNNSETMEIDFPMEGLTLLKTVKTIQNPKSKAGTILCSEFEKVDQIKPVFKFTKYRSTSLAEI